MGNGFSFASEATADFSGGFSIVGEVTFELKRNKWICIPYAGRFKEASLAIEANVEGEVGANAELNFQDRRRLWQKTLDLRDRSFDFNVEYLRFRVDTSIDLILALDVGLEASLEAAIEEVFLLEAEFESQLECDSNGCEETQPRHWSIEASGDPQAGAQATVEAEVIPSAELVFEASLHVGDPFWILHEELFEGKIGIVAELPAKLYATSGNLCSDADGDGVNEHVSLVFLDLSVRVSGYAEVKFALAEKRWSFASLSLPGFEKTFTVASDGKRDTWYEKNIYFNVVHQGESSPLQPVITHAGSFYRGGGDGQEEGIVISGPRSCYPFEATPEYEIDWSRSSGATTRHEGSGFVAHDWANDGAGDAVAVRIIGDDSGRRFTGPWVTVEMTGGIAPNGHRYCVGSDDADGDGWGFENGQSCVIAPAVGTPDSAPGADPICRSASSDPDGDGWGWENGESCRVGASSEVTDALSGLFDAIVTGVRDLIPVRTVNGHPVCKDASSDPDGDGWGWENNDTCIVA